ncbi:hypothetical protein [Glutamicibacter sp. 2E12]|uniref:hypothetical protein n=1 Tax=Glutamicibacter sp. 2E12 TaxID=3416181 RepID=UPI003CE91AE1
MAPFHWGDLLHNNNFPLFLADIHLGPQGIRMIPGILRRKAWKLADFASWLNPCRVLSRAADPDSLKGRNGNGGVNKTETSS